jgi:hypothetical protein
VIGSRRSADRAPVPTGGRLTFTGPAGRYLLPPMAMLRPGSTPEAGTEANDIVVATLRELLIEFKTQRSATSPRC